MKVGYIILCRYNSSRLPGKILRTIQGKPILEYIIERLGRLTASENIVVATSEEVTDDPIATYCKENRVQCYRGALDNVALRFLGAAKAYGFDYALRINGDNIFGDNALIQHCVEEALKNHVPFVSNIHFGQRTFPRGMSIEVLSVPHYEELLQKFDTVDYQEHVTLYLYHHPLSNYRFIANSEVKNATNYHFAIDTAEDFEFAQSVINEMRKPIGAHSLKEIIDIAKHVTHE